MPLRTVCLLLPVLSAVCTVAQAPGPTIKVKTSLVNLSFTVHDASGALVADLKRDEVEVFEDGIQQRIAFFSKASDVPLTLGLIVDASGSQDHFTHQHQHDLQVFLNEVLRPQDRVFLVCFGNHLRLASDFTNSPQGILNGLEEYKHGRRDQIAEIGPREERELGTAFYDSIYYSVTEKMATVAGKRALMVFSDGEDNSSSHEMMETIEAAQAADVEVFTLRYTERKHGRLTARNEYGTSVMGRIARETGAISIDAATAEPGRYFHDIANELRDSYEVAYYPADKTNDGTFRKIRIKPLRESLTVRARTGYVSTTPAGK